MQRSWEANGNPRINLCSSPPPPLAGPCPPSPRYSPPVMPELLLANNNAPTPAIPEHFKGEVDKGAGSGWGREGKYRSPPSHPPPAAAVPAALLSAAAPGSPPLRPPAASPRVVLSLSLSSFPPAPFPVSSSSRLLLLASGRRAASPAATRRCRSSPRPRGSLPGAAVEAEAGGEAPEAAPGCPSRPGSGGAPSRGAAEGEGWNEAGKEGGRAGARLKRRWGPLKGAARAPAAFGGPARRRLAPRQRQRCAKRGHEGAGRGWSTEGAGLALPNSELQPSGPAEGFGGV